MKNYKQRWTQFSKIYINVRSSQKQKEKQKKVSDNVIKWKCDKILEGKLQKYA